MPLTLPLDFRPFAGAPVLGHLLIEGIQQLPNEFQQLGGVLLLGDLGGYFTPGLQSGGVFVTVGHVEHLTLRTDLSRRYDTSVVSGIKMECNTRRTAVEDCSGELPRPAVRL